MTPPKPPIPDEFAWADPPLKQRLQSDPRLVLKDRGINVPEGLPPKVILECVRIVHLLWVDGRIVPINRFYIDPMDDGLLFGRGVWESTRTIGGVPWLWPMHINRLIATAKLLDIPLAPERLPNTELVTKYVRHLSPQDVVVRLNVTAGRPGFHGMVWMSAGLRPFPKATVKLQTQRSATTKAEPYQMWKTFAYAGRLRTGQQAFENGFDTALMTGPEDQLLEASHANIFLKLPEGWATPSLESGLFLPGTVRQYLLENAPIKFEQKAIPKARLAEATEAFVTNSNVGIVSVEQIDGFNYPLGPDTAMLQKWLDLSAESIGG